MAAMVKSFTVLCTVVVFGILLTYYNLRANVPTQTENREFFSELQTRRNGKHSFNIVNAPRSSSRDYNTQDSYPTKGFVLAGDYWEQFSSASRNLQNLQCWAGKLGVKVLEPYSVNSILRSIIGPLGNRLRFSDLIDLEHWNKESVRMGRGEVVPWETFIKEASRDVILVQFKFTSGKTKTLPVKVKKNPSKFPSREIRYKEGCSPKLNNDIVSKAAGFKVIRKVCLNFEYGDALTMSEFDAMIYGPLNANKTTVYFREWRGLSDIGRITVKQAGCSNTGLQEHMPPSPRLMKHVHHYIAKYLHNGDFIAIIARIEKAKKGLDNREGSIEYCLTKTLEQWTQFSAKSNMSRTFLSIDMGKYGSRSFKQNTSVLQEFNDFFRGVYGNKWSIKEWERSFEDIGDTSDSGYVALLQKMIVTRAKCILFVGGGSFQKHALALYQTRVPEDNWCIRTVPVCTRNEQLTLTQT